jgi:hypothetical protein
MGCADSDDDAEDTSLLCCYAMSTDNYMRAYPKVPRLS